MRKVPATFEFEKSFWKQNKKNVVGIDEVGRGAWAGPLVAAAVIFPENYKTRKSFYDSKLLNFSEREKLSKIIKKEALCFGVGEVEVFEVEKLGLTAATQLAYTRALEKLNCEPEHYLIDAFYLNSLSRDTQTPIIHGDYLCSSIAAASIVAKVYRDNLMIEKANDYPNYSFEFNKGYGTIAHQEAIRKFGLSSIHRKTYNLKVLNGKD